MDKRILNAEEINYIKHFIKSHGFKDEGTVIEILDHTACLVEELLTENSDMQFEEAVRKAHESFGYKGFASIANIYQESLKKKYRTIYWQAFKKIILHPIHFVLLAAMGFSTYIIFVWTYLNDIAGVFDFNVVAFALLFIILCFEGYIFEMTRKEKTDDFTLSIARSQGILSYTITVWLVLSPPLIRFHYHDKIYGILYALILILCIVNFFARYITIQQAQKDYSELNEVL